MTQARKVLYVYKCLNAATAVSSVLRAIRMMDGGITFDTPKSIAHEAIARASTRK